MASLNATAAPSPPSSLGGLFSVGATSMLRVLLTSGAGILAARFPRGRPLLHSSARRDVGALMINVAWPAMAISNIGASLDAERLAECWSIVVWAGVHIAVASLIAVALSKVVPMAPSFRAPFVVAGSFANSAALPMLMMETLCEDPVLVANVTSKDECIKVSFGYIMVYVSAGVAVGRGSGGWEWGGVVRV